MVACVFVSLFCRILLLQVLELTQGQRFPLQTAEALMDLLEQQQQQLSNGSTAATGAADVDAAVASATDAAREDADAADEPEVMAPPEQLLQMLSFAAGLPDAEGSGSGSSQDAAPHASASAVAAAAAHQRNHQAAMQQFGGLLKQVTNSPACGAAVWGLLGRWNALQGNHLSSQEARLKQVRVRLVRVRAGVVRVRAGCCAGSQGRAWLTPTTHARVLAHFSHTPGMVHCCHVPAMIRLPPVSCVLTVWVHVCCVWSVPAGARVAEQPLQI